MTRLRAAAAIAAIMIVMATSECSRIGSKKIKIDNHLFHVPEKYIVQGTIPWLPGSQSSGLKFILNPEARPDEQMIVTIGPTEITCNPTAPPASSQLASACSATKVSGKNDSQKRNLSIEKIYSNGDTTQWEYRAKDGNIKAKNTTLASCYALADKNKGGLCTSLNNYGDLVYSIGLRDKDIPRLSEIRNKVYLMLSSWDQRKK